MAGRASNIVFRQLLGVCMPTSKPNAAKIRITHSDFDEKILMYFKKFEFVYAHDPDRKCKTGDIVLVENLPKKLTRVITHKVLEVVYPLGDITDPVTGKKIVASKYREDIIEANKLYGELESTFNYDKAPPRGTMEDKRDFSHKKSYIKYHEDPKIPQPYGVNP